jgi:hypothetical protein
MAALVPEIMDTLSYLVYMRKYCDHEKLILKCDEFICSWHPYYGEVVFRMLSVSWGGVRLSPLGMSAAIWHIVPTPDDG